MDTKEITKKLFDYVIISYEINSVINKKVDAVKQQDFQLASEFRAQELKLRHELPSMEDIKELRKQLD